MIVTRTHFFSNKKINLLIFFNYQTQSRKRFETLSSKLKCFKKTRCIDNSFIGLELIIDNRFRIDNWFRIESLTSESESNRIVRCQEIPTPNVHRHTHRVMYTLKPSQGL